MPIGNPIQKNNDTRVISATATTGQTDFTVTGGYTLNAIGVFRNGVRLNNSTDFTAADGSTVSLNVACDAGDTVTFHIFDKFTVANAIVGAASTQTVFGNLTLNGELYADNFNPTNVDITGISTIAKAIIGTGVTIDQGNIDTVGIISATTFTGNVTGNLTGTASQITVAGETSDTTCFPVFVTTSTGNQEPKTRGTLTFNSSSGALGAPSFVGGTVSGSTGTFTGDVDIADKIIHTGDTNTAIRFPAADTFTIETAGSERVRVDSSGNFGINTNNPTAELDVERATGTVEVQLQSRDSSDCFVSFGDNGDSDIGQIRYAHSDNSMRFTTNTGERLRITSAGLVGIGSDNPDVKLTVCASSGDSYIRTIGGTNQGLLISNSAGTLIGGFASGGALGGGVSDVGLRVESGNNILFSHGTTERARIDSSGRVLINSSTVLASYGGNLQVTNSNVALNSFAANAHAQTLLFAKSRGTSGSGGTIVQDNDYCGHIEWYADDGENTENQIAKISGRINGSPGTNDTPGELLFYTTADGANTSTERLRIDSNGMIGIGGVTPKTQNTFDAIEFGKTGFLGSQTGARTVEMASNAYYNSGWKYKEADVATQYYQYNGYHAFTTAASGSADAAITFTERLRINSDGQVLVGSTANYGTIGTAAAFQIQGTSTGSNVSMNIVNAATSNASSTCDINAWQDYRLSTRIISGRENANNWTSAANQAASFLAFYTNSAGTVAERFRIMSNGNAEITDGNLKIGTSGHGIDFSAHGNAGGMTSELLDDYEEGTWTPSIGTTSGATVTGEYRKIGAAVHIQMYLSIPSHSNSSTMSVSGLPFSSMSSRYASFTIGNFRFFNFDGSYTQLMCNQAGTTMTFREGGDNTGWQNAEWSQVSADFAMYLSGTYFTD